MNAQIYTCQRCIMFSINPVPKIREALGACLFRARRRCR